MRKRIVMQRLAGGLLTVSLGVPSGPPPPVPAARPGQPVSRSWIVFATDLVRSVKPSPPAQARLYAYVASVYADTLAATKSSGQASEATRVVLQTLLPAQSAAIDGTAQALHATSLSASGQPVLNQYLDRVKNDGYHPDDPTADMANAPTGIGKWIRRDGGPLAPSAGGWLRWSLPASFAPDVPPPIRPDQPGYEQQKQGVQEASARRDATWTSIITFWAGAPGTEGPSGIWLNRLWTVTQGTKLAKNDLAYARTQKALSQTVADAFMECWKVKYTYWTERPDMAIPGLVTGMKNPPFPSYLSGHSTVSAAAATVLGKLIPSQAKLFMTDAEQARDSRLYAGIHFPMDNEQGFALGQRVGNAEIASMNL